MYNKKIQIAGFYFVLPTLIIYGIFLIYPMITAFHYSFFKWNLLSEKKYVGLSNFAKMINDKRFWNSYITTFHFTLISIVLIIILSFILALILEKSFKFKNIFQSAIFIPVILTMVSIAVVWQFMFQSTGILSNLFIDLFGTKVKWLTSTKIAPYSMILVNVWKMTGYYMIIFIAGLLNVPNTFYEAARVDGANYFERLIYITLPQMKNTFILVFVSGVIFSFAAFPQQYVMTEGGPGRSTEVLALLIYKQAFEFTKFGYSSSISVAFFASLLLFSIIQLRLFKSESNL
ncbi:MAG: sugar ABC transporter permease [Chloroflexota bacterium]|nr:sugar ABC transporter permease [Chloroflexota bacterium]|tara:strand:- start:2966 stop:3832 length:867 start_codon:yes stop_codon:yes gene_type:complete